MSGSEKVDVEALANAATEGVWGIVGLSRASTLHVIGCIFEPIIRRLEQERDGAQKQASRVLSATENDLVLVGNLEAEVRALRAQVQAFEELDRLEAEQFDAENPAVVLTPEEERVADRVMGWVKNYGEVHKLVSENEALRARVEQVEGKFRPTYHGPSQTPDGGECHDCGKAPDQHHADASCCSGTSATRQAESAIAEKTARVKVLEEALLDAMDTIAFVKRAHPKIPGNTVRSETVATFVEGHRAESVPGGLMFPRCVRCQQEWPCRASVIALLFDPAALTPPPAPSQREGEKCERTYITSADGRALWCDKAKGHTDAHRWNEPAPPLSEPGEKGAAANYRDPAKRPPEPAMGETLCEACGGKTWVQTSEGPARCRKCRPALREVPAPESDQKQPEPASAESKIHPADCVCADCGYL